MSQHCIDNLKPGDLIEMDWKIDGIYHRRTIEFTHHIYGSFVTFGRDANGMNYCYNPNIDKLIRIIKNTS